MLRWVFAGYWLWRSSEMIYHIDLSQLCLNSCSRQKEHFTNAAYQKYGSLGTSHSRDWNAELVNTVLLKVTPACSFHFFSIAFVGCYKGCRPRTGWQGGWWKAFLRGFLDLCGWARESSQRAECRDAQNQRQCPGARPHTHCPMPASKDRKQMQCHSLNLLPPNQLTQTGEIFCAF